MTVWDDAQRSSQLAHSTWMANTAVLMHLNERATGDPARDWLSSWAHRWFVGTDLRVLVLGCGEGWLERAVAQWPFVAHIDAVDFAEHAVARAREAARDIPKITYGVVDLNRDELPRETYDVVVAHSVLHHVENLEHAYAQIERTMKPNATLVMNEYAGPSRFQFSDDVLSIMNTLLACFGYPPKTRPTVEEMIANDPTEAVRSDELLAFTARFFEVMEQKEIGGTLLQHMLYGIAEDFRFDVPRERSILEILCTIDAMLVDLRRVPCDYMILAARKRGSHVTRANRPLPPRAHGAEDVERDPLWSAEARPPLSKAAALPPHSKDRLIRLALLARQSKRANLYKESRIAALLPRRTKPTDPQIECLLHTAARLASE